MIADNIRELLDDGVCLIPATETDKVPLIAWSNSDFRKIEFDDLAYLMGRFDTNAVAIVLGKVSGNLVCIDVDSKYEWGFEVQITKDIQTLYPELWERMTIDKTPSGGLHILYRVNCWEEKFEYSCFKCAERYSTEEELIEKPKYKTKCFLEIKANGGLCQSFPSPNYRRIKNTDDGKIGVISESEHKILISLCCSYTKVLKEEKTIKTNKKVDEYYEENPFASFDKSTKAETILEDIGWKFYKDSGKYRYFTKPNGKAKEVHASFNFDTRLYKIYTTSTELDTKSYSPSNLLAALKFNGDKTKDGLYGWLVKEGYGKIKANHEEALVRNRARYGGEIPQNISEEGKKKFEEEKKKFSEKYPLGVFWIEKDNGGIEISQMEVDRILLEMGYRFANEEIVLVKGYLIQRKTDGEMFHDLLTYIGSDEDIYNEYSAFIHRYGKLTVNRLIETGKLPEERLLISNKFVSYKFYKNLYIRIDKEGWDEILYTEIGDKLVFEDMILDRDFNLVAKKDWKEGKYWQYLNLSLGESEHIYRVLGYLTHDFVDDSMSSIFVGLGKGGSGKNLFFNLLNHITSVHVIDGRQAELDKNLLQSFNYERILVISDVEKDFDLSFFKNFSSGAASLKKLYKNIVNLKRKQMPKPVILTNFSYDMVEGLERRVINLEFTDFFRNIKGGVYKHFGCMFPEFDKQSKGDWTDFDWNVFDSVCLFGIMKFLEAGELLPNDLSSDGWENQFNHTYKYTADFIIENIEYLLSKENGFISGVDFERLYFEYCRNNHCKGHTAFTINNALSDYCLRHKITFDKKAKQRENTVEIRGRRFERIGEKKKISVEDAPF